MTAPSGPLNLDWEPLPCSRTALLTILHWTHLSPWFFTLTFLSSLKRHDLSTYSALSNTWPMALNIAGHQHTYLKSGSYYWISHMSATWNCVFIPSSHLEDPRCLNHCTVDRSFNEELTSTNPGHCSKRGMRQAYELDLGDYFKPVFLHLSCKWIVYQRSPQASSR